MRLELGADVFRSKKEVLRRARYVLHRPPRWPAELDDDEQWWLADLLAMHPEAREKIGVGIDRMFIDSDGHGSRCFWVRRTDGTTTGWSYRKCVAHPNHHMRVTRVFRWLVIDQTQAFRDEAFETRERVPCAISQKLVVKDEAQVDHRPPDTFAELTQRFLKERGLSEDDLAVVPVPHDAFFDTFGNEGLAEAWQEFHEEHAVLQITDGAANLRQGHAFMAQKRAAGHR